MSGRARERGREAEECAARFLKAEGYSVLCRNFGGKGGELDLVVRKGDTVAFVEVRSLSEGSAIHPVETIDRGKRARIFKAALRYLVTTGLFGQVDCRFDVIAVRWKESGSPELEHIRDAFGWENGLEAPGIIRSSPH